MNSHPLIVIHNITTLTTNEVEKYCLSYDKNLRCFRKKDRHNHQYIHVLFSSTISSTNFLNARPHFINNCRTNSALINDPQYGANYVCVLTARHSSITEDDLYEYTSKHFGRVLTCVLFNPRGYAFIEFDQLSDAHCALASSNQKINGYAIQYYPRHKPTRIFPPICLTRLIHIGNFSAKDQSKLQVYFSNLQKFTIHENCYGQIYILGLFSIHDSIQVLFKRPFCLNKRVLNIFIDNDDKLTECNNYLLVRNVPYRLNDYNLLEYFSQYGRVLNCYRYGQTNAYRVQYRDRKVLNKVLELNRIHVIKSVQIQIELE